jgi:uncharacterized protein (TIGR02271 family)
VNQDRISRDRIAIAHEELSIDKKTVETGRVRINTRVDQHTAWVEEELAREDVQAEWIDVNREIDEVPEIRTEGATLIIPLFEEVLVVEKRLVLRQELRLTRRIATRAYQAEVPLRRMHAEIERAGPSGTNTQPQEIPMRTLTALYDTHDHAERAREQLIRAGLTNDDVELSASGQDATSGGHKSEGGGLMKSVKNFFMPDEDRHAYHEGVSRGGVLLTAHVPEGQEDRVMEILDTSGAIDFDARQSEWRSAGWTGEPPQRPLASEAPAAIAEPRATSASADDMTIPIAEERLSVGKREVDRGTVRVRSYVTEQPVHEQVSLHEEHVNVERRPVNQRLGAAPEGIFEERSFEVSERGEEAVVAKETVVTDELHVTKEASDRTEDIEDTVRRTEVDVDDGRGRTSRDPGPAGLPRSS